MNEKWDPTSRYIPHRHHYFTLIAATTDDPPRISKAAFIHLSERICQTGCGSVAWCPCDDCLDMEEAWSVEQGRKVV